MKSNPPSTKIAKLELQAARAERKAATTAHDLAMDVDARAAKAIQRLRIRLRSSLLVEHRAAAAEEAVSEPLQQALHPSSGIEIIGRVGGRDIGVGLAQALGTAQYAKGVVEWGRRRFAQDCNIAAAFSMASSLHPKK
ncbi:hypothetical protein ADUPG1_012398 [Aduncisulcus paluster]|uniref:Uncharacterized protein n=1 Tax=Aduncisulcus paluster TaxID=2918883 RepID=A0ABQ5K174_9EUKA|nr:hypothetical protein ADUPG1_012398 [Aduncisulcus paluster]|eukprot:gnl/Carplike_NY0171/3249_a4376_327.p1 GENE.gnl/Carplike_NY0171/3249_a4376_327~~gnl/Carplike_NY0171/3249_a4376_327.p1  ORF type:complete len:138 (-),score=40.46 gnl/Carplike_NY0171/3249_a4376_327:515-928(-)